MGQTTWEIYYVGLRPWQWEVRLEINIRILDEKVVSKTMVCEKVKYIGHRLQKTTRLLIYFNVLFWMKHRMSVFLLLLCSCSFFPFFWGGGEGGVGFPLGHLFLLFHQINCFLSYNIMIRIIIIDPPWSCTFILLKGNWRSARTNEGSEILI